MTVKELIEMLQEVDDQHSEVLFLDSSGYYYSVDEVDVVCDSEVVVR